VNTPQFWKNYKVSPEESGKGRGGGRNPVCSTFFINVDKIDDTLFINSAINKEEIPVTVEMCA
jgi:hypothetical protein